MNYHIYAEGMIESLKAENAALLEDHQTLCNRFAGVCGALADAGDVVYSPENPGEGVRMLLRQRDVLREQLTAEREKRAALVAEWRCGPLSMNTPSYRRARLECADQLAALDQEDK